MQGVSVHDRNKWQMTATPARLGQATVLAPAAAAAITKRGESSLTPHYYYYNSLLYIAIYCTTTGCLLGGASVNLIVILPTTYYQVSAFSVSFFSRTSNGLRTELGCRFGWYDDHIPPPPPAAVLLAKLFFYGAGHFQFLLPEIPIHSAVQIWVLVGNVV